MAVYKEKGINEVSQLAEGNAALGQFKSIRHKAQPIVLSNQRYQRIMNNAQIAKEDTNPSESVTFVKNPEQKLQVSNIPEFKEKEAKRMQEDQKILDANKENAERIRREKIQKAEELLDQLKPGPRDLKRAADQSKILRACIEQRNINAEFKKAAEAQKSLDILESHNQNIAFVDEERQRMEEQKKRQAAYRQEVQNHITERAKKRTEEEKVSIAEEKAAHQRVQEEIQLQNERERELAEKKQHELRQNALQALIMVEQQRKCEVMQDNVQNKLIDLHLEGKSKLDSLRKEYSQKMAAECVSAKEANKQSLEQVLIRQQAAIDEEQERVKREIASMQLKFIEAEQERINREQTARCERIQAHQHFAEARMQDGLRAKEMECLDEEQSRRNAAITAEAFKANRINQLQKAKELEEKLNEQVEEKKRAEVAARAKEVALREQQKQVEEHDDKFFFDYAKKLIKDAKNNKQPLHPFIKPVEVYKRENRIGFSPRVPRHLVTSLKFGRKQSGDSQSQLAERMLKAEPFKPVGVMPSSNINDAVVKVDELLYNEMHNSESSENVHDFVKDYVKLQDFNKKDDEKKLANVPIGNPEEPCYTSEQLKEMNFLKVGNGAALTTISQ